MRWQKSNTDGDHMELLIDENSRTLGRVRLTGERWVAFGANTKRAVVVGYFNTREDAKLALERHALGELRDLLDTTIEDALTPRSALDVRL